MPPCCGRDYVTHVGGPDAELVADHTFDATDYLLRLRDRGGPGVDTDFTGPVPGRITHHVACRTRREPGDDPALELLQLTGAEVTPVDQCSGLGESWGQRAVNDDRTTRSVARLTAMIERAGGDVVTGGCASAAAAIAGQTAVVALHPFEVLAAAYGMTDD